MEHHIRRFATACFVAHHCRSPLALLRTSGLLALQGGSKFPERSSGWKAGMAMQKTYVLDTNILIQAPYALESFEDNHIVLPLAVLEALDELQQAEGDQGGNARQVIRYLEQMRLRGNLVEGVALPGERRCMFQTNCSQLLRKRALPLKACIQWTRRDRSITPC